MADTEEASGERRGLALYTKILIALVAGSALALILKGTVVSPDAEMSCVPS